MGFVFVFVFSCSETMITFQRQFTARSNRKRANASEYRSGGGARPEDFKSLGAVLVLSWQLKPLQPDYHGAVRTAVQTAEITGHPRGEMEGPWCTRPDFMSRPLVWSARLVSPGPASGPACACVDCGLALCLSCLPGSYHIGTE